MQDKLESNTGVMNVMFGSYWGSMIDTLLTIVKLSGPGPYAERMKAARLDLYKQIREDSGLDFPDYGDEPEKWLAWLKANDTNHISAAYKLRDENLRRRAVGLEGFYDWSPIKGNY